MKSFVKQFSVSVFSLLFCLCLTFDIYIYKEKINYILISIKNETTLIKKTSLSRFEQNHYDTQESIVKLSDIIR